jgi:hypothetical protein
MKAIIPRNSEPLFPISVTHKLLPAVSTAQREVCSGAESAISY